MNNSHNPASCNTISIAADSNRITIAEASRCQSLQSRSAYRLKCEQHSRRLPEKRAFLSASGSGKRPRRPFPNTSRKACLRLGSQGGHQGIDEMQSKPCSKCGTVQPLTEFYAKGKGTCAACKACYKARNRANSESRLVRCPGYASLRSMITRCHNPNHKHYKHYGGRGIRVCDEWRGPGCFERFIAHIGPRPSPLHEVDRVDNDGNYEPGNVRWATRLEQRHNQSR
jgi:hypothetical protein